MKKIYLSILWNETWQQYYKSWATGNEENNSRLEEIGPANIWDDGLLEWCRDGRLIRDNKPT